MVTQFQLIDDNGTVLAHGEIDGEIYRVFASESSTECEEFVIALKAMYADVWRFCDPAVSLRDTTPHKATELVGR